MVSPFTLFVNHYSYLMMAEIESRNMKYNWIKIIIQDL